MKKQPARSTRARPPHPPRQRDELPLATIAHPGYSIEEMNAIGQQIRALRRKRGWSQEHLALSMGTSQSAIARLEATRYDGATIRTLRRASAALGAVIEIELVEVRRGYGKVATSGR